MACSSDPELVKFYLALEKGLFNDIAGMCHFQMHSDTLLSSGNFPSACELAA